MSTGYLHLTFNPPAEREQLLALRVAIKAIDEDAPTHEIVASGTILGDFGRQSKDCEQAAYWRSPGFEVHDALTRVLQDSGLNGHGYLVDPRSSRDGWEISDLARFTFGSCPDMAVRIATACRRDAVLHRVAKARNAVLLAASTGDDDQLIKAARELRVVLSESNE